ncbi:hypothetical protein SDC9_154848 [bioreactor metagenome]|uniref:Uncharacterized protein n=1 Tax=bioreactor metagenome TaxID=1076179 RepID=A0A645F061_9ZZZZ
MDAIGYIKAIMNLELTDSSYIELLILMTIAVKRLREGHVVDVPPSQLKYLQAKEEYKKLYMIPHYSGVANLEAGCKFCKRCEYAFDKCTKEEPPLIEVEDGRRVRCWLRIKDVQERETENHE